MVKSVPLYVVLLSVAEPITMLNEDLLSIMRLIA